MTKIPGHRIPPCVVSSKASIVGSELKAFTISKRFSGSTEPSSRKYVTLLKDKHKLVETRNYESILDEIKRSYKATEY